MPRVPRGGCGTSVAASGAEFAWLNYSSSTDPAVTVAAHGNVNIPWYHFITTNSTIFSVTSGNPTLHVTGKGIYIVEEKIQVLEAGAIIACGIVGDAFTHFDGADAFWWNKNNWITNTDPTGGSPIGIRDLASTWSAGTAGVNSIIIRLLNYDAAVRTLDVAYLKMTYIPTTADMATVFG